MELAKKIAHKPVVPWKLSTQNGLVEKRVGLAMAIEKIDIYEVFEDRRRWGSGKAGRISRDWTHVGRSTANVRNGMKSTRHIPALIIPYATFGVNTTTCADRRVLQLALRKCW